MFNTNNLRSRVSTECHFYFSIFSLIIIIIFILFFDGRRKLLFHWWRLIKWPIQAEIPISNLTWDMRSHALQFLYFRVQRIVTLSSILISFLFFIYFANSWLFCYFFFFGGFSYQKQNQFKMSQTKWEHRHRNSWTK